MDDGQEIRLFFRAGCSQLSASVLVAVRSACVFFSFELRETKEAKAAGRSVCFTE